MVAGPDVTVHSHASRARRAFATDSTGFTQTGYASNSSIPITSSPSSSFEKFGIYMSQRRCGDNIVRRNRPAECSGFYPLPSEVRLGVKVKDIAPDNNSTLLLLAKCSGSHLGNWSDTGTGMGYSLPTAALWQEAGHQSGPPTVFSRKRPPPYTGGPGILPAEPPPSGVPTAESGTANDTMAIFSSSNNFNEFGSPSFHTTDLTAPPNLTASSELSNAQKTSPDTPTSLDVIGASCHSLKTSNPGASLTCWREELGSTSDILRSLSAKDPFATVMPSPSCSPSSGTVCDFSNVSPSTVMTTTESYRPTSPKIIDPTTPAAASETNSIDSDSTSQSAIHASITPNTFSTSTSSSLPEAATVASSSRSAPLADPTSTVGTEPASAEIPPSSKAACTLTIILSVVFGVAFLMLVLLLAWRRFHKKSFDMHMSWCPGFTTLHRWSETRSRNRSVRSLRATYTGDNNGFMDITYGPYRRTYHADATKARAKESFETISGSLPRQRGHLSFSSPMTQTSNVHRVPEPRRSRARRSGTENNSDTESIESWQEKWHGFGHERNPVGASTSPSRYSNTHEPRFQWDRETWT
ncbi:uncharacterized protein A1O9_01435 [Exophiala aquamarina CBS 119918]|uniref:Uncharacterized protein n=1 Tax=Exophiala aquamarina CBS 119918 TaxID=1182545 RepID=A0A072PUM8_9EURO|nr:uncharacterized protein A1O9_01435 [Exophiala aquamarina CBS 119918]KEF63457.1 hypothetical protein A1O9_01435 [Exophiala aquamarina CBS 119918]